MSEACGYDKVRENRLRRIAHKMGWRLYRSRARILHMNNRGMWQLVDYYNTVVAGVDYDADLDMIEHTLNLEQERLRG